MKCAGAPIKGLNSLLTALDTCPSVWDAAIGRPQPSAWIRHLSLEQVRIKVRGGDYYTVKEKETK